MDTNVSRTTERERERERESLGGGGGTFPNLHASARLVVVVAVSLFPRCTDRRNVRRETGRGMGSPFVEETVV